MLEVGNIQYLFKLFNFIYINNKAPDIEDYDVELVRTFNDNKHYYKSPVSIRGVYIDYFWRRNNKEFKYTKDDTTFTDIIGKYYEGVIELPILKNSKLTALLNPEEIWQELQNYISSLNNESKVDNMSDIEKVVSHGFDKKTSFRSNK